MNSKKPLFLVVEDHPEVAANNCDWLKKLESECRCLTAVNPEQAIERLKLERPDLIVVDILFGNTRCEQSAREGLGLLRQIFEQYPTLNVLVYSSEYMRLAPLMKWIDSHEGGFAVANKFDLRSVYLERARSALNGELRIPRELRQQLKLTDQEAEILRLLCEESLKDQAMASRLSLSKRAVQNHVLRLKEKLGVDALDEDQGGFKEDIRNSRVALCVRAGQYGLLRFRG